MSLQTADGGSYFAQNPFGNLVHVAEVPRGLRCECICLDCGKRMIARQGPVRTWHFAHYESTSCVGMTWLHRSAQEVLRRERRIISPNPDFVMGEVTSTFASVKLEVAIGRRTVDCLCVREDGSELIAEIRVTHEVEEDKIADLISEDSSRDIIEIDLRPYRTQSLDWNGIAEAVCSTSQNAHWLYHPFSEEPVPESTDTAPRVVRRAGLSEWNRLIGLVNRNVVRERALPRRPKTKRSSKPAGRKRAPASRRRSGSKR